jgi:predicted Zn-ribbon and HTH transcriptional regulator
MTLRKTLLEMLTVPRTASSLVRELGLKRGDIDEDLRHLIRSARAAGHAVVVEPARCKACGFIFSEDKLDKPGKCPVCRATRVYEPLIRIDRP